MARTITITGDLQPTFDLAWADKQNTSLMKGLSNMLLWAYHDEADDTVTVHVYRPDEIISTFDLGPRGRLTMGLVRHQDGTWNTHT